MIQIERLEKIINNAFQDVEELRGTKTIWQESQRFNLRKGEKNE